MFLAQDSRGQRRFRVAVLDGNSSLRNDGTVVHFFVDEMHRYPGDLAAVLQRLFLRVEPLECGQEGRVNIDHAIGERPQQRRRDDAIEAREGNRIGTGILEVRNDRVFKGLSIGEVAVREYRAGNTRGCSMREPVDIGSVAQYGHNLRVQPILLYGVDDGTKVGTPSGYEYPEFHMMCGVAFALCGGNDRLYVLSSRPKKLKTSSLFS